MALVVEGNDNDVCNSWEDIDDNAEILEKQLARLKLEKTQTESGVSELKEKTLNSNTASITLDSTTQESLRTQYAPPEPKMTILARPKENNNTQIKIASKQTSKTAPAKSLQQREQEYAAARMRILGDVRFEAEEAEAEMEAALSPAEILKLKVAEAVRSDGDGGATPSTATPQQNGHRRNKRSREKIKTSNPEPIRDFPVPKTDLDRIIRHPRGPDGSSGFTSYRS
ncbi:unnamed protein product [Allacma fusca]|uniref:SUZ RNA-binding domain-containing n=1 Tax=Allacma fusca TaxID=39272 RepID=A0A8J2JPR7_9HEXA|nr:unnamed protein product [Allacma fusca]